MHSKKHTLIIAEAGVNHNGDLELAMQLIDAAAQAGADAVKFQTFRAQDMISRHAKKAAYQIRESGDSESQLDMIRKLELSVSDHEKLLAHANERKISFLSTPFDQKSLQLLVELGIRTIKIPSGEITNAPLLLAIARSSSQVILSTGMSTLGEIEAALAVLAYGFLNPNAAPHDFESAYASRKGQEALRTRVSLLHCTTEYPTPFDEVNLLAMDTMAVAFSLPVGLSDHTIGIHIPIAAVARGAHIIEKHITLDCNLPGPDHRASLESDDFAQMVSSIRSVELALGDSVKRPMASEWKNRDVARKSLVAIQDIKASDIFTTDNLGCKRPGNGLSPMKYFEHTGRAATRSYILDELIDG